MVEGTARDPSSFIFTRFGHARPLHDAALSALCSLPFCHYGTVERGFEYYGYTHKVDPVS